MYLMMVIAISVVLFVYYKVVQARVNGPMEKGWYSAKGSIAIGVFFISFGVNSYNSLGTQVAAFVALLFVSFGLVNIFFGIKRYRTLLPFARREVEEQKKMETKES